MKFLTKEIPVSNSGSTGRTLRCVKYATEYLKKHGNNSIHCDYTLLKLKNDHRRIPKKRFLVLPKHLIQMEFLAEGITQLYSLRIAQVFVE